ncbi:hypothetical protein HGRIS_006787 [Hohenbuehelia grisea]|uniref:CCHC-type domain-containing protein n=1 Tax=Hohenbuehelia grisea TaxID=104357 RepID=A0ABR3JB61_9AGAR
MVTEPDSYTFKTQLMAKIPRGMALKLIERGISAENSNLRRIVSAARQYEEAQQMVKVYDAQREQVSKKPPKEDTSKQSSRMPGQGHTNDQSHTRTPGQGNRDQPKGFSKPYGDRRPGHRSGGTKPIRSGPPAEYKSSAACPPYQKAPQGRSKTPGQPSGQCYACGSRGHYSNNPVCPKYQAKARMQAGYDTERDLSGDEQDARTVSDLGEDHQEGLENDSENVSEPDEGNDGDPNDADGALDEFEGYPDDEVEHNGRMTEQAFGMRIHDSEDEYSDMPALETPPDSDSEGEMIEPVMQDDQGNELLLDRLEDLEVTEPQVSYDDNRTCSWVLAIAEAVEDYNWFQYREYRGDVENATWERPPYHFVSIPGNLVWDRTAPAMVNVYIDDVTVGNDIANDETESASGSSDDESDDHWDEDPWAGSDQLLAMSEKLAEETLVDRRRSKKERLPPLDKEEKVTYGTLERPRRTAAVNRCLVAMVNINGVDALTLFDSGCTADSLSPEFALNARVKAEQLKSPVTLQLGTVGSRLKINFGCTTPLKCGGYSGVEYFDIVNIDRYDAIIGTVLMRKLEICLDFGTNVVRSRGKVIHSLSEGEETAIMARRYAMRRTKRMSDYLFREKPCRTKRQEACLPTFLVTKET